jgi:hypothetical protein
MKERKLKIIPVLDKELRPVGYFMREIYYKFFWANP